MLTKAEQAEIKSHELLVDVKAASEWDWAVAEKDPSGLNQHQPGAKLDNGKPNLDLVLGEFGRALTGVGAVGTFGARKYTPRGWLEVDNAIERYLSAMLRHYLAMRQGEEFDKDSNLPHAYHMAWNALAVAELKDRSE